MPKFRPSLVVPALFAVFRDGPGRDPVQNHRSKKLHRAEPKRAVARGAKSSLKGRASLAGPYPDLPKVPN